MPMKINEANVPKVLDGIAIAAQIKAEVAVETAKLKHRGITPGLAVILVGEVPASQIYVRSRFKHAPSWESTARC